MEILPRTGANFEFELLDPQGKIIHTPNTQQDNTFDQTVSKRRKRDDHTYYARLVTLPSCVRPVITGPPTAVHMNFECNSPPGMGVLGQYPDDAARAPPLLGAGLKPHRSDLTL